MFNRIYYFFQKGKLRYLKHSWSKKTISDCYIGFCNSGKKEIFLKIKAGIHSYGCINFLSFGKENELLLIGNYCSIASSVFFILGGNHDYSVLSTYHLFYSKNHTDDSYSKGPIIVKDDVWIGFGATILSGVTIGQGAIVGAKSVVTKDVPPYAIVCGNPARIVKYRFSPSVIDKLENIDYSKIDLFKGDINKFYIKIDDSNVDEIIDYIMLNCSFSNQ